jgi:predicted transcriptional regulator
MIPINEAAKHLQRFIASGHIEHAGGDKFQFTEKGLRLMILRAAERGDMEEKQKFEQFLASRVSQ